MALPRKVKVVVALVVGPILLGALALVILATTPWGNERVRRIIVSQGNDRLTGELIIDRLRGNLFSGATLTNVQVMDSLKHPVFAARGVQVKYALLSVIRGKVVIRSLVLDTPVVVMDKRPGERWNFQSLLRPSTSPRDSSRKRSTPELSDITIRHGRFLYRRPWRPDSTLTREKRDAAIAKALDPAARKRTVRVPGGYQRIVDYRNIDAKLPTVKLAQGSSPIAVQIAALSMLAEPYRPPSIDIRSLVGTLYASKDSLWWRDARMVLPGSNVRGDGKIGFKRSGFTLDLTGAPIALADLRWLDPRLATTGGGKVRYRMRLVGDTAEYAISDADLRYRDASVVGNATVARVKPDEGPAELLVRGADLTVARLSTAIIHELAPSVKLTRSGVLDGRLVVSGTPEALDLDADFRFDDAVAGRSHVVAKGGVGFTGGLRARNLSVRMDPLQVATLSGAGLKIPLGGTMSGSALVNGAQREGWSVSGDVAHAERGERSHLSGSGRYTIAGKRIVADATLEPLSLVTVGRFAPDAQLRGSVTGRVHAAGTTRDLRINGVVRSRDGGGVAEGRGTVSLAGSRTRYDVSVAVDALNARAFSRRAPVTKLTGTIMARGVGTKPATANSAFAVDLVRSSYDTFSIERVRARGAVANGLLRLDTLDAVDRGIRANASGTLGIVAGQRGTLTFAATIDSMAALRRWIGSDSGFAPAPGILQSQRMARARADSARRAELLRIEQLALGLPTGVSLIVDTLPSLRRDSLAGSLDASGVLRGNVKELGVDATVTGSGLVARGYAARRLDARLSASNVRDRRQPLTFDVAADTVRAASYAFDRIDANGRWQDNVVTASLRARQDSLVSYAALGSYGRPAKGSHLVRLDSLSARFDTLTWRLAHPGGVRLVDGAVAVDSIDLRSSAGGRLFANGTVPREGSVRLDVAAEKVRVATVLTAMQRRLDGDGVINASAQVTGTRTDPRIRGEATLREARYGEFRAPDADLTTTYAARVLGLDVIARDSTNRRVLLGHAELPLDLSLAKVSGSRKLPGALLADVVFDSLEIGTLPIRPRILDELRGKVAADAHVRGTWASPTYSGVAALRDGALRMSLASTGMRVDSARADVRLTGDSLVLDSLVARARGTLRASGTVDLRDRSRPFVRFTAGGTDLRVFDSPRGLVDADAQISAEGPLEAIRVTGGGEMKGGFLALKQFRKDLLRVKAPGDLSFFTVYDTSAGEGDSLRVARMLNRKPPPRVGIIADLSLVIDRGNFYRNRPDANTEFYTGAGEVVRAHLDTRTNDQWAIGFVRIGDAGGAVFRTRAFMTSRGSMTFVPHTGAPASTQQVGERIVWEPGRGLFPVQLLTGGTSTGPAIGLEGGTLFPIRGRELNGYLTMGRLSLSLLQQSGSSLSGSTWSGQLSGETGALARRQQGATALGVVLHDIGTGTTKEYGLDAFAVSPADVPTELVFGKTGGVRGALIAGGRYVTTDLFVAGQLRFTTGIPGLRLSRRFRDDYRFDIGIEPRFLFRAPEDLGITHPTDRSGAFGVFLTRMWELW